MTNPAKDALDRAIAEYIAATGQAHCLDYVLVAAGVTMDDHASTEYFVVDSGAAPHVRLGLIRVASIYEESPSYDTDED